MTVQWTPWQAERLRETIETDQANYQPLSEAQKTRLSQLFRPSVLAVAAKREAESAQQEPGVEGQ